MEKIDKKLILLLGLPLVLFFLNDGWLFSTAGPDEIDAWLYFGYFLDLKEHLIAFPDAYFGARLSWILPGFLAYKFLPPLIVAYALRLLVYYTAAISLYLILKRTIDERTALLTAVLLESYCYFLEATGSHYVDGVGLTYLFLTLLMLTNGSNCKRFSLRLCLAGVFYACSVWAHFFVIVYFPLIVLYYMFITCKRNIFTHIPRFEYFLIGFLRITILFCVVNYFLNGNFIFFQPSLQFVSNALSGGVNPMDHISFGWMQVPWLALPAVTFLGGLLVSIFFLSAQEASCRKIILFFLAFFILNALIQFVCDWPLRLAVLRSRDHVSFMIPAMFLAIGSLLSIVIDGMKSKRFYFLLCSVIVISISPYILNEVFFWVVLLSYCFIELLVLFDVAGIFLRQHRKEIAVLMFASFFAWVNNGGMHLLNRSSSVSDLRIQKHGFLAIFKSVKNVQTIDPKATSFFWYDIQHPLGKTFRAVCTCYLWGRRCINEAFPLLGAKYGPNRQPVLNDRIFILATDREAFERANVTLAQIGLQGKLLHEKEIKKGRVLFLMQYIEVCELAAGLTDVISGET